MNKLVILMVFILIMFFARREFMPTDKEVIITQFKHIAQRLDQSPEKSNLKSLNDARKVLDYFIFPLTLKYSSKEVVLHQSIIKEKNRLKDKIIELKSLYPWIKIEFDNFALEVIGKKANSICILRFSYRDSNEKLVNELYELKNDLVKLEGQWLIKDIYFSKVE